MRELIAVGVGEWHDDPVHVGEQVLVLVAQVLHQPEHGVQRHRGGDPFTRVDHRVHEVDRLAAVLEVRR